MLYTLASAANIWDNLPLLHVVAVFSLPKKGPSLHPSSHCINLQHFCGLFLKRESVIWLRERGKKTRNTTIYRQKLDEMSLIFPRVGGSCNVMGSSKWKVNGGIMERGNNEVSLREKCGGTSLQREDYTKPDFVIRSEENTAAWWELAGRDSTSTTSIRVSLALCLPSWRVVKLISVDVLTLGDGDAICTHAGSL